MFASLTDPSVLALIFSTFLIAGIVKGIVGLGLPIVVLAMLTTTLGLKTAMALFIIPGVAMNVWQGFFGPALWPLIQRFWLFWAMSVGGILVGTTFLAIMDPKPTTIALGLILALYAALKLSTIKVPTPGRREGIVGPIAGVSAGLLFGATGTFMVPGILFVEAVGLRRDEFVQAIGLTFLIITSTLGASLFAKAILTPTHVMISCAALVPAIIGLLIGRWLRQYISEAMFRKLLFVWLAITGVFIAVRASF